MRVVIDQYYYKQRLYTDVNQLIEALKVNGVEVEKSQIPSNVGWQKRFWNERDVHWEQVEIEQNDEIIKAARMRAKTVINQWVAFIENPRQNDYNHVSLTMFNRYTILAKYDSQYIETVGKIEKFFYELYKYQNEVYNQIDSCLTTEQIKMILDPSIEHIRDLEKTTIDQL